MPANIPKSEKIEDFLNDEVATRYSLKNHHVQSVRKEVFGTAEDLFVVFTDDIKKYDGFRKDLWKCLGADVGARPGVAEQWIMFLKLRINVLESWSGLYAAVAAILGLTSVLFISIGQAVGKPVDAWIPTILAVAGMGFIYWKFCIDKKIVWYKFVVAQLEVIAKPSSSFVGQVGTA